MSCDVYYTITRNLPVFNAYKDIHANAVWRTYLHSVYGNNIRYPLDLRCFLFFWKEHLDPVFTRSLYAKLANQSKRLVNGDVIDVEVGFRIYSLDASSPMTPQIDIHSDGLYSKDVPYYRSHTRIEIFHSFDDCAHGHTRKDVGFWGHFAPGSGVYANLGRTMVVSGGGYGEACRFLLGPTNPRCRGCCTPVHHVISDEFRKRKIDSLQSCCGYRGGNFQKKFQKQYEISFYNHSTCQTGLQSCPEHILSFGMQTPQRCHCDKSMYPVVRCRVPNVWRITTNARPPFVSSSCFTFVLFSLRRLCL